MRQIPAFWVVASWRTCLEFAIDHDLGYWHQLIVAVRLMCDLGTGRWGALDAAAQGLLKTADLAPIPRLTALLTLGRLKARRGEPDAGTYLDQALAVTREHGRVGTVTPAWPALAEAVWLSGNRDATLEAVRRAEAEGTAGWNPWAMGDLALWAFLVGGRPAAALTIAEP